MWYLHCRFQVRLLPQIASEFTLCPRLVLPRTKCAYNFGQKRLSTYIGTDVRASLPTASKVTVENHTGIEIPPNERSVLNW